MLKKKLHYKAEGWIIRKKTSSYLMVGILIEIKLPHSASQNKNPGCLERRSSTSSRNVNAELWSQPFKIGFTWINKSSDAVHEIAQEGRRLWVIICAAEHTLQIILTGYLWINSTCSVCSALLCSELMSAFVHLGNVWWKTMSFY